MTAEVAELTEPQEIAEVMVHHLLLSEHEVTMLNQAGTTLWALARVCESVGVAPDMLAAQAEMLQKIDRRLRIHNHPIELATLRDPGM